VAALKRQRPSIWEAAQKVLEKCIGPVKRLGAFFQEDMPPRVVAQLAAAVPVVACRAVCDWYFQRCLVDSDQLEKWWSNTKATLQRREALWDRLLEQEGLLLRRIGEEEEEERRRYTTLATFGGTELEVRELLSPGHAAAELDTPEGGIPAKLEDSVSLVANVVSEMVRRLRQIRDSALWRVIDAAQAIHRQLCDEAALVEVSPWQATGPAEGLLALFEALDDGAGALDSSACADTPPSCRDEAAVVDMALIVMRRLEHLGAVAADLRGHLAAPGGAAVPSGEPDGVDAVLCGVCAAAASLNEELLGLVDEPSAEAVEAWLGLWRGALAEATGGRSLEGALAARAFRPDSELGGAERQGRRRWMELLRGLQVFLDDPALQAEVTAPLGRLVAPAPPSASGPLLAPASPARAAEGDASMELLSTPPSPNLALSALALPRAGGPFRPPQRLTGGAPQPGAAEELVLEAPPRPAYLAGWRPGSASRPGALEAGGSEPSGPGQASRFLNGHYAVPRPASAGTRLPPLELSPTAAG
ncbi:unnamed protein product, partial [Prorocentrum cordatum]